MGKKQMLSDKSEIEKEKEDALQTSTSSRFRKSLLPISQMIHLNGDTTKKRMKMKMKTKMKIKMRDLRLSSFLLLLSLFLSCC